MLGIGVSLNTLRGSLKSGTAIPANAIRQRDGSYILDRAGSYIEVRA